MLTSAYMDDFTVPQFELKSSIIVLFSFKFQLLLIGSLTTGLLLLPVFYYLTLVRWDISEPAPPSVACGSTVASCLDCSPTDGVVRVWALAGDIVLCSRARHLTLTVPLSTQVFKWVPANLMLRVTLWWISILQRGGGVRNICSHFVLLKQERSTGLVDN